MINKFYDIPVGTTVGVMKAGSWGSVSLQGLYKVTKCNGNEVRITRESDGYIRTFSNRNGCEKHSYGTDSRYHSADIIDVDKYEKMVAQKAREQAINGLWTDIQQAVTRKNFSALKTLVAELERQAA